MALIKRDSFAEELYYSKDAINMSGDYQGLWVRWRAIDKAIDNNTVDIDKMKAEIQALDPFHFTGEGCGAASEMKREIIGIMSKYI